MIANIYFAMLSLKSHWFKHWQVAASSQRQYVKNIKAWWTLDIFMVVFALPFIFKLLPVLIMHLLM